MHLFDLSCRAEASYETSDGRLVTAEDSCNQLICQSLLLHKPHCNATLVCAEVLAAHGCQAKQKGGGREEGGGQQRHTGG